eukprot:CAMPEP_0115668130 /NCGR_PEP_ID=MMETSP0272-20121206/50304_1 /TAXON_ID=71861 /ORGANISM="Scrippsiella trochoidea, Strain CCMP3099" /LENGTH=253 /DNA_ID=CAMNT_0003106713 /DNA_START=82 /DNA_END=840 /DNA_ORIENTATION=-
MLCELLPTVAPAERGADRIDEGGVMGLKRLAFSMAAINSFRCPSSHSLSAAGSPRSMAEEMLAARSSSSGVSSAPGGMVGVSGGLRGVGLVDTAGDELQARGEGLFAAAAASASAAAAAASALSLLLLGTENLILLLKLRSLVRQLAVSPPESVELITDRADALQDLALAAEGLEAGPQVVLLLAEVDRLHATLLGFHPQGLVLSLQACILLNKTDSGVSVPDPAIRRGPPKGALQPNDGKGNAIWQPWGAPS